MTQKRPDEGLYIDARIGSCINNLKVYQNGNHFHWIREGIFPKDAWGLSVGINKLQFYQARHTFATLSRNLMKFSKGDVDEALNHFGSFEVADIYIEKDFSIINDNNFKLIKRVFKNELAWVYRFFDGAA